MHVVIRFLDKDFPIKLPFKSVSEHVIFNGKACPQPPSNSMLCMLVVLCTTNCIVGKFGGKKVWRIWQIVGDLPN